MSKKIFKLFLSILLFLNASSINSLYSYAEEGKQAEENTITSDTLGKPITNYSEQNKDLKKNSVESTELEDRSGIKNEYLEQIKDTKEKTEFVSALEAPGSYKVKSTGPLRYMFPLEGYGGFSIGKIEFETTEGCELHQLFEGKVSWGRIGNRAAGTSYPNKHLAVYDFGFNFTITEQTDWDFLGLIGATVLSSDYDVTIKIHTKSIVHGDNVFTAGPYHNFFGGPSTPKQGTVKVKYVDENGQEIVPEATLTGNVGEQYKTEAKQVAGYVLKETPSNATGTYTEETQTVTYVYKRQQGTVKVKYVNEAGQEIAPEATLIGNVGEQYKTEAKQVAGYVLKETPSNATGTYTEGTQTVTYVYKRQQGTVKVKYVDENGQEIVPEATLTGNVGEQYKTEAKQVAGYVLKETPSNATGTYTEETQTVTYVYKRQQGTVKVKYVNEAGQEIAPEATLIGNVGEQYKTEAKQVAGYVLKETPSNATGTYTEGTQTVTYVYKRQQGTVKVKYVNEAGQEIAPEATLTGNVGEQYKTEAKQVAGYVLKETPSNATGTYTEGTQTVTYVYKRQQGTVKVKYVNEAGQEIAPEATLIGNVGEQYKTEAKQVAGYVLKETPSNATGTYTEGTQTVTYVYQKKQESSKLDINVSDFDQNTRTFKITVTNNTNETYPIKSFVMMNSVDSEISVQKALLVRSESGNSVKEDCDVMGTAMVAISIKTFNLAPNTKCFFYITLTEDYAAKLPESDYETSFQFNNEASNERIVKQNFFGKKHVEPDYYLSIPKEVTFTDIQDSSDVSVSILNKDDKNNYVGNLKVQVNVTSANGFKLINSRTNATVPYSVMYGKRELSSTDSVVGELSKDRVKINGVAKLLEKDTSNKQYQYTDTLTYEIIQK